MKIDGLGQSFSNINPNDQINAAKSQTDAASFQNELQKAFSDGDKTKLKKVCNEFETVMLQMMYKQMKATVPDDSFVEKSNARGIFEDMLDENLMEKSSQRGMGISDMMYKQLSTQMDRMYKVQKNTNSSQAQNEVAATSVQTPAQEQQNQAATANQQISVPEEQSQIAASQQITAVEQSQAALNQQSSSSNYQAQSPNSIIKDSDGVDSIE